MVPLGELIAPARIVRAGDTEYPILSMTMHEGLVDQSARFSKRIAGADLSMYRVVRRGQMVVGFPIDEGVLDFQQIYDSAIVSPAYGVWDICSPEEVDARFLSLFLRSPRAIAYYKEKLQGSTARRRSLPARVFGEIPVPLPWMDEQRRIAAILDQADAVRARRRELLNHLDELESSVFDAVMDEAEGVEIQRLGDIADLQGGRNLVADDLDLASTNRVLKISAVTSGSFLPGESKPLPSEYRPPAEHFVKSGDLLISRANTEELVGATAYVPSVPDGMVLPDKIWKFIWKRDADPYFYHALFSSGPVKRQIRRLATGTGGSMKNVSKTKLLAMLIPDISMDTQSEFSERAQAIRSQRATVQRALDADNELFASLQSRAFRGEL